MSTLRDKLAKIADNKNEEACAEAFEKFCIENAGSLPLPGEDSRFDKAMWAASEFMRLSKKDEDILKRVTGKLLGAEEKSPVAAAVLKLKDLVGHSKETAIATWQDMLSAMAWQQMVPAGALRGVGTQMVSLGTFQKQIADANIQVNIGWMVDKEQLRILLQAKNDDEQALSEVELRVTEAERGVVYSRKTNEDGAVVAPSVHVGPGQYQIQVLYGEEIAETPFFVV